MKCFLPRVFGKNADARSAKQKWVQHPTELVRLLSMDLAFRGDTQNAQVDWVKTVTVTDGITTTVLGAHGIDEFVLRSRLVTSTEGVFPFYDVNVDGETLLVGERSWP
jgi:hypothetical protein